MDYTAKTDREIRELARDWMEGRIFTSDDFEAANGTEFGMIFMPLFFADRATLDDLIANEIALFYEYLTEAGPRSINGYPSFSSVRFLNRADHGRLREAAKQYRKLQDQFVGEDVKLTEPAVDDAASCSPQPPASSELPG
jgi:hypothetical protein